MKEWSHRILLWAGLPAGSIFLILRLQNKLWILPGVIILYAFMKKLKGKFKEPARIDPTLYFSTQLIVFLCFAAILGTLLSPCSGDLQSAPGCFHVLGLDRMERDTFTRILRANQNSLLRAGTGSLIGMFLAGVYALALSSTHRWMTWWLHAFLQIFLSFPLLLLFLVGISLGGILFDPSHPLFMMVMMGLVLWAEPAKLIHAKLQEFQHAEFVIVSRMAGFSRSHIFFHDLLPNLKSLIAVNTLLAFISALVLESILGFMGIGYIPGEPNLGQMIYSGLSAPTLEPVASWAALTVLFAWIFPLRNLLKALSPTLTH